MRGEKYDLNSQICHLWAENSAILIFFFCKLFSPWDGELTIPRFPWVFFGCTESFKKNISVDFIVQCVWILEHVELFSYDVENTKKHMDKTKPTSLKREEKKKERSDVYLQNFSFHLLHLKDSQGRPTLPRSG